jgi:hypothetical protein
LIYNHLERSQYAVSFCFYWNLPTICLQLIWLY